MRTIQLFIDIQATREEVWAAIISDKKYRLWTAVFEEGSYFEGGWQQGNSIKFLSLDSEGNKRGMVSEIAVSEHLNFISIKHLGLIMDEVEDYTSDHALMFANKHENYRFEKLGERLTRFQVTMELDEEYAQFMEEQWNQALVQLKAVCEDNLAPFTPIRIETVVDAPLERVWEYWTKPEHVTKWNFASNDWYCPKAFNDLSVGGRFAYTMSAKDESMAFDFSGTYTQVEFGERIINQLDDGRMMSVFFEVISPNQTHVVEIFEAEGVNSLDLQRSGWQAILDNFKSVAMLQ